MRLAKVSRDFSILGIKGEKQKHSSQNALYWVGEGNPCP